MHFNFSQIVETITNHPQLVFIILIIFITLTIFLSSFRTLFHELGHATATILAYGWCKINKDKNINFKLNLKIHWKYNIWDLFIGKTLGGTESNFREYILNKPQYYNHYFFIVLSGLTIGSIYFILLILLTILFIPNDNYWGILKIMLIINEVLFFVMNILNYMRPKNDITSDRNKIIKLRKLMSLNKELTNLKEKYDKTLNLLNGLKVQPKEMKEELNTLKINISSLEQKIIYIQTEFYNSLKTQK